MLPVLLLCACAHVTTAVLSSDGADTNMTSKYSGKFLQRLGAKMDEPILRILGKSIEELEENRASLPGVLMRAMCMNHQCAEWSEWSKCSREGKTEFGSSHRSRQCGVNNTLCTYSSDMFRTERDWKICEFGQNCSIPINCHATKHGYCLEYYYEKKNQSQAEAACKERCGELVKINSQEKFMDIRKYKQVDKGSWTSNIWISGIRDNLSSPWRYRNGGKMDSFRRWKSGQPSDIANEFCIVMDDNEYWLDRECDKEYHYICEF